MPGRAIPIRDSVTWKIAFFAAFVELPRRSPDSVATGIPSVNSLRRQKLSRLFVVSSKTQQSTGDARSGKNFA